MKYVIGVILRIIKLGFGVVGIFTGMYWASLHAKFGLLGKCFGQETLDWVNDKMNVFNDWLPYFVFVFCLGSGLLWLGSFIYGLVRKKKDKEMTKAEILKKIKELNKEQVDLLDKLK